jgi:hypothetical protein
MERATEPESEGRGPFTSAPAVLAQEAKHFHIHDPCKPCRVSADVIKILTPDAIDKQLRV